MQWCATAQPGHVSNPAAQQTPAARPVHPALLRRPPPSLECGSGNRRRGHLPPVGAAGEHAPPTPEAELRQPVRPPEVPLLLHAPLILWLLAQGCNLEDILLRWARRYGPFVEWQLPGTPPVVHICDPAAIREAYETRNYPKSPLYRDLLPVLGEQSMVIVQGEQWRQLRTAFAPGFSSAFLQAALPGFADCSRRLVARLEAAAAAGEMVRMHDLAVLTTLEVICQVGFGERVDLLLGDGTSHPLWTSFEALGRHVAFYLDNVPLNRLKLLPWNVAKTQRLQADLDGQLLAILRRRLAGMGVRAAGGSSSSASSYASSYSSSGPGTAGGGCPFHGAAEAHGAAPLGAHQAGHATDGVPAAAAAVDGSTGSGAHDILSLAVELSAQDGAVDEQVLLSQMKTFFAAGHDTTASLVAWAVWFLCSHPEAEARLVAELQAVQTGNGGSNSWTWQQLHECEFLGAVLKETLRVRPPVGLMARQAPPGASLAGCDVSGKILLVSPFVLHRDAAWGEDAEEWRPERWLGGGTAAEVATTQPWRYLPFSRGPRNCIGERFALLEARTILAMLYSAFHLQYAGPQPERVLMTVTAHPRFRVPVRVRRRQQ